MPEDFTGLQNAWERWPGEGPKAYAAFSVYLELPPAERTILKAYQKRQNKPNAKKTGGRFSEWANTWHWVDRAAAWDAEVMRREREGRLRAAMEDAQKWERRRLALIEREWETSERLLNKADLMLEYPLTQDTLESNETGPDGLAHQVIIRKPTGWRFRDAGLFASKGSELGRKAASMATEIVAPAQAIITPDVTEDPLARAVRIAIDLVEKATDYTQEQIIAVASQVSGYPVEILRPRILAALETKETPGGQAQETQAEDLAA